MSHVTEPPPDVRVGRASLGRRLADLVYRLRPQQPVAGAVSIPIAAEAQRTWFPTGEPLDIVVWNTFKGRRERYYDVLATHTTTADLILLQEFRHDPALEAAHRGIFAGRDADLAVSFYTLPQQEAPTGVCTVSAVRASKTVFVLSRYLEPVTRTPKLAICTVYPLDQPTCPPDEGLLVFNSHAINFRLRRPFLDQMLQFEAHLRHHRGPIILVGDFNTWEGGRVHILDAVAHNLGLHQVSFPPGVTTVRGHALDRVYVRGGRAVEPRVVVNTDASDHSMLAFRFFITGA